MKTWKEKNTLKESSVQKALDQMTDDLYKAICTVYQKWEGSIYHVSDVIDLCIEDAVERARKTHE